MMVFLYQLGTHLASSKRKPVLDFVRIYLTHVPRSTRNGCYRSVTTPSERNSFYLPFLVRLVMAAHFYARIASSRQKEGVRRRGGTGRDQPLSFIVLWQLQVRRGLEIEFRSLIYRVYYLFLYKVL